MTGLLAFHAVAAARGDGLHPKLRQLFEQRAALAGGDPRLVDLATLRDSDFMQAGAAPAPRAPEFLPGNVIEFKPAAAEVATARKTSSELPTRKEGTSCTSQ